MLSKVKWPQTQPLPQTQRADSTQGNVAFMTITHQAKTVVLKLECASDPLEGLLKHNVPGPNPRVSDSVGVEWGLIICLLNKFSCGTEPTVGEHTLSTTGLIQWIFPP